MKPALLLGLSASAAALNVNRRDALKGTTASVAQIALPTASLAQVALPAPALAATEAKLALPRALADEAELAAHAPHPEAS